MPGSSTIELVDAGIRDLASALQALSRSDSITAGLRQPFEQLTTALTANLREAVAMYFPSANQQQIPAVTAPVAPHEQILSPPPGLALPLPAAIQRVLTEQCIQELPTAAAVPSPAVVAVTESLISEPVRAVQRVPRVSGGQTRQASTSPPSSWRARPAVLNHLRINVVND
jgi:hypothetical protein